MDYIRLANRFWKLHKEVCFSTSEIALYLNLLDVCNSLSWKNPFQQANAVLCAALSISEKTLITARVRLQKEGLVVFIPGHKRNPTTYHLAEHTSLFSLENIQDIVQHKLQAIGSVSGQKQENTLENVLENVASSLKGKTSSVVEDKDEEVVASSSAELAEEMTPQPASQNAVPETEPAAGRRPSPHADEAQLTTADTCPLLNTPATFRAACLDINPAYAGIDFEHYRLEMRFGSKEQGLNLMPYQWRKRLRHWLTNAKNNRSGLILAAVPGQTNGDPRAIKPLAARSSASPTKSTSWS